MASTGEKETGQEMIEHSLALSKKIGDHLHEERTLKTIGDIFGSEGR